MPQSNGRILADDTPAEARDRLLKELLALMERGELQDHLVEVWKRLGDEDRLAFLVGCDDFLASFFAEGERAAIKAGAHLAMLTAKGEDR